MAMNRQLGKQALLDAAALLMDERGVDNVSASRTSTRRADADRSAVQYHFGTRDAVIQAVMARTMEPIDAERNLLLDHLECHRRPAHHARRARGRGPPLARQLRTAEGRRYVRIGAQLDQPPAVRERRRRRHHDQYQHHPVRPYLLPSLDHLPAPIVAERTSQVTGFVVRACGDQSRLMDSDPPTRPVLSIDDFTINLVDTILAILQAPSSVTSRPDAPYAHPVESPKKALLGMFFPAPRIYRGSDGSVGRAGDLEMSW